MEISCIWIFYLILTQNVRDIGRKKSLYLLASDWLKFVTLPQKYRTLFRRISAGEVDSVGSEDWNYGYVLAPQFTIFSSEDILLQQNDQVFQESQLMTDFSGLIIKRLHGYVTFK